MEMIEVEAFAAIAEAGSFTRAARGLRLSQPAISRRIDLLERELGAPLFARLPEGARLTEAGEAFLPHARRILAAARDGAAAVRASAEGEAGAVSLALVGTLASTPLTARLRAFRAAHPAIRLALRTARSDEVSALVAGGEVQLGLRYFAPADPALAARLVGEEALCVVCAATSAIGGGGAVGLAALTGLPWVTFPTRAGSSGEPFARVLERQLLRCGLEGAELLVADSLTTQKRLIESDFGLGLLPASSVEEEVRLGTLRVLPLPELAVTIPIYLLHRREGFLSRAARRLIATLADES